MNGQRPGGVCGMAWSRFQKGRPRSRVTNANQALKRAKSGEAMMRIKIMVMCLSHTLQSEVCVLRE